MHLLGHVGGGEVHNDALAGKAARCPRADALAQHAAARAGRGGRKFGAARSKPPSRRRHGKRRYAAARFWCWQAGRLEVCRMLLEARHGCPTGTPHLVRRSARKSLLSRMLMKPGPGATERGSKRGGMERTAQQSRPKGRQARDCLLSSGAPSAEPVLKQSGGGNSASRSHTPFSELAPPQPPTCQAGLGHHAGVGQLRQDGLRHHAGRLWGIGLHTNGRAK